MMGHLVLVALRTLTYMLHCSVTDWTGHWGHRGKVGPTNRQPIFAFGVGAAVSIVNVEKY